MAKVVIKKNVKPKIVKQKQKQTQKTNVTVNIGTTPTKRKRGRPSTKQPVKPVKPVQTSINPIIQSYNQPIFKQPNQQPTSLTSSILATQEKPKVVAEEVKEQTSLRKAIQEQNTQTEEPVSKVNDIERVRKERVKKFDKPKDTITENTIAEMKKEEPIRHALLGQILSDQQDDTEEINALKFQTPEKQSFGTQTSTFDRKFNFGTSYDASQEFNESIKKQYDPVIDSAKKRNNMLRQRRTITALEPIQTGEIIEPTEIIEQTNETPLDQPEQRGAAELVTQTEPTDAQPLSRETVELGFGGLTEEPVQTSVGQFLPPEPVSQNELIKKKSSKKLPSILQAVEPPPPITQAQETPPPITEQVRAADQYVTERLVKDEPPGGAPLAQAEVVESKSKIPSEGAQIEEKWNELKTAKLIKSSRTLKDETKTRRTKEDLLAEINSVSGYEDFKPIPKPNRPGPKKKVAVAEAIEITDV
jgi:hypothetical protein